MAGGCHLENDFPIESQSGADRRNSTGVVVALLHVRVFCQGACSTRVPRNPPAFEKKERRWHNVESQDR